MARSYRFAITSNFLNYFDVAYYWTTSSSISTSWTWDKASASIQGNYPASGTYYLHFAICPKSNATNYIYSQFLNQQIFIPSGTTTSAVTSITDSQVREWVNASFSYDTSTHNYSNSNMITLTKRTQDIRVDDGYGGYSTLSGAFVSKFGFVSSASNQVCKCLDLDILSVLVNCSHCTFSHTTDSSNYSISNGEYFVIRGQSLGYMNVLPDEGYQFNSPPSYEVMDTYASRNDVIFTYSEEYSRYIITNCWTQFAVSSGDKTEFIFTATGGDTPITENYEFIQVYNPSNDDMGDLANIRFIGVNSSGSYTVDLGQYILDVFKLYINIPTDVEQHIFLLNYDTNIECPIVSDFKVITDCGKIYIDNPLNTSIIWDMIHEIYLPFIGIEKINPDKYVFKEIGLKYITDILTGDTTIYTYTEGYGYDEDTQTEYTYEQIIDTWNKNIAYKIPYRVGNPDLAYYQEFETNSESYMDKTPIIYQYYPDGIMGATNDYNYPCNLNFFGSINPLRFYPIRFTDVQLSIPNATSEEKEELINLFESGVIYYKI